MLKDKKILLGVTGSIAAYKAAILVRLLVREGAQVRVVMTDAAKDFITPLTLSTLSKQPVVSGFIKDGEGQWNNHVDMAGWADAILVAPATAHFIAQMAHGLCDHVLHAVILSATCPVFVAPAMDLEMYRHSATRSNIDTIRKQGVTLIPVGKGELASGLIGEGRMEEPEQIVELLKKKFDHRLPLKGKKALVTAGPTREPIDAVRYISNHSTGKMGIAIARELALQGAKVTLVSGPVEKQDLGPAIEVVPVTTAEEMYKACMKSYGTSDLVVMAAAVADYTVASPASSKMKKQDTALTVGLKPTKDILKTMGEQKKKNQVLVGFALETDNETDNARGKRKNKNLDMIVLNSLNDEGAGFGHVTNKVSIIDHKNRITTFELKHKNEVARDIVQKIISDYYR